MSSSVSVVLPRPFSPKPSNSDLDEDENEIEYEEIEEEIEVEEEVEVEEEIEEEVPDDEGDDESGIGEDLTPVREEIQGNDTFQVIETKEHEEPIKSSSVTLGVFVSNPPTDIPTAQESIGDSKVSESSERDSTHVKGEGTSRNNEPKVSFEESGEVNDVKRKPFDGNSDVVLAMNDGPKDKDNDVLSTVVETNPSAIGFEEDMQISPVAVVEDRQISPRLHIPHLRLRDSSSSAEFDGENKRQKTVCEFYAKGWCIKGNSCRFLHTKEGLDAAVQKSEVKKEASSSAFISPHHVAENSKLNGDAENLVVCKDDGLSSSRLPPGRESHGQNSYSDNFSYYAAPPAKGDVSNGNSTYPGSFSGRFGAPDYHHHNSRISTFETALEERINRKSDVVRNHFISADMSHPEPRQPFSFGGLSSWNADALGTKNHLKSSLEHRASVSSSVQQSTSPFSCSGPESLLRNRVSKDTKLAKYETKVSSNDWVPSVPFRPSHDIIRNLLLKESLYDPIRDSIDQREIRDGHVKSSSDQGSSMNNVHKQLHNSQEEDRLLNAVHVEGLGKHNVPTSSYDNRLNFDKPGEPEMKVDAPHKNEESGIDFKKDGYPLNEEKAHKNFQAELIEYVKELLKPTWREGLMSKDAYKMIVKKASDKVLSSLQPNQILCTSESIQLYLSASQSKLAKLVEGYIEKYGKC